MKPPSPTALRQYAQDILNDRPFDWNIHWLCEENIFVKKQVEALMMEPFIQQEFDKNQKLKAEQTKLAKFRRKLKQTCLTYRSSRAESKRLHRNTYPNHLRLKRNELEKQGKWDRFLVSIREYRTLMCLDWIDRRKASWMSDVIWSAPNPFVPIDAFPYGSCCQIDPQMSPNWELLEPPTPPTKIEVENSYKKRLLAYERALEAAYYKTLGITKPKPSITTTDEHGQRTTNRSDSGHTASPLLSAEQWMEKQLHPEVPGEEEHSEEGV